MKLIGPISQLITMEGLPLKGPISDVKLVPIVDGGIVVNNGVVVRTGSYSELESAYPKTKKVYLEGKSVIIPGFIDAHTHLCWSGSRASDFAMRNAGLPYLTIAEAGGGIWDTVTKTRASTDEQLFTDLMTRINRLQSWGVTTVEIKSGYGLSTEHELRILRTIQKAGELSKIDIVSTCLAAHVVPKDYKGTGSAYLEQLITDLLPVVKKEKLSKRVDIFIEKTAFDVEEASDYILRAKSIGFEFTIHADQFTPGGALLGVELGARSVDHLEASTELDIKAIALSETVALALPGASVGLGEPFAPVRRLLDSGGCVAIASDWNPGSAPLGNLLVLASIIATYQKLTTAEVFASLTVRAAKALNLTNVGSLKAGNLADFQRYEVDDYREILYQQGMLLPNKVWKRGVCIYE